LTDLAHAIETPRPRAVANIALAIIVSLLAAPAALLAITLGLGLLPLPYPLFVVLQRLPVAFPLHMIASALALILIPIAALLRRHRVVHRAVGRAAALCVAVGGTTALLVALASEATIVARAGLFAQGLVWLALLALAVVAIRCGAVTQHARLMIAMAAVASGAIWLRLVVYAAVSAGLPFDSVYAVATWACWLVPLVLAAYLTKSKTTGSLPGRLSCAAA
jgi:hypothetical protein